MRIRPGGAQLVPEQEAHPDHRHRRSREEGARQRLVQKDAPENAVIDHQQPECDRDQPRRDVRFGAIDEVEIEAEDAQAHQPEQ